MKHLIRAAGVLCGLCAIPATIWAPIAMGQAAHASWDANADPVSNADTPPTCMLSSGRQAPMVMFIAAEGPQSGYVAYSNAFSGLTGGERVSVDIGGENYSLGSLKRSGAMGITGRMSESTLDSIVNRMALASGTGGTLTLNAGGTSQSVTVNSAASEASMFNTCRGKL